MIPKDDLQKLAMYFVAAATASLIRFLRNEKKSFSVFMIEMLMGASFAFFVVPMVVDYYGWSLYYGTGLTWVLTMLSESVLRKIESRINKKIDDVADNIDK